MPRTRQTPATTFWEDHLGWTDYGITHHLTSQTLGDAQQSSRCAGAKPSHRQPYGGQEISRKPSTKDVWVRMPSQVVRRLPSTTASHRDRAASRARCDQIGLGASALGGCGARLAAHRRRRSRSTSTSRSSSARRRCTRFVCVRVRPCLWGPIAHCGTGGKEQQEQRASERPFMFSTHLGHAAGSGFALSEVLRLGFCFWGSPCAPRECC
jgi:hypothetical protein